MVTALDEMADKKIGTSTLKVCRCCGKLKKTRKNARRCFDCWTKIYAERHPGRKTFHDIKHNAKRRHIPFTISYEYFMQLPGVNDYLQKKGLAADALTIDRKENHLGYIPGNIQFITKSQNTRKYFLFDKPKKRLRSSAPFSA